MRSKKQCYKILELDDGDDNEKIKKAYRKLALTHHPDKGGDVEKFREISEACTVLLSNPETELDDWEDFDPINFFKEQFTQNDIFIMVHDYGLFDNLIGTNDIMGTLFSNIGNIMTDQDKIFNLANNLIGDENNIFNTLKSTHAFAKDLGSRIKDVTVNINASIEDVYTGKITKVAVKRRRFKNNETKKFTITLCYEKFKLPHEGHQISETSTVCGDIIFNIKLKNCFNITRFKQDHILVEYPIYGHETCLNIKWANDLCVSLFEWKKDNGGSLLLLKNYGFLKNEHRERGDMIIHVYITLDKGKERSETCKSCETCEACETCKSKYDIVETKEIIEPSLISIKNILHYYNE